jgi:transketolase
MKFKYNKITPLSERGIYLRRIMLRTLFLAGRGHLPSAFSLTEALFVLYDNILSFNVHNPNWNDRDRLILSKGHGCLALYAILAEKGFFPISDLDYFCSFNSHLGGHPERGRTPGIEASTGSLGHGPSIGVGMALAAKMDNRSSRIIVICGDGETEEGSVWEAMLSAAKHKLDNFTLLIDYNKLQSWGKIDEICPLEPYIDKWTSFGAKVVEVDGHDVQKLYNVFKALPFESNCPSVVIMNTIKGRGIPSIENNPIWHHRTSLSQSEYINLLNELELK